MSPFIEITVGCYCYCGEELQVAWLCILLNIVSLYQHYSTSVEVYILLITEVDQSVQREARGVVALFLMSFLLVLIISKCRLSIS